VGSRQGDAIRNIAGKLGITFGTGSGSIYGDGPLGTKGNGNNTALTTTSPTGGA
jgi:hypothetical protein